MKRKIYQNLIEWKKSTNRIPLIITGARQVGKTYIINEFGKNEYENVVYCNLENELQVFDIFNNDIDPKTIINKLEIIKGEKINPKTTLIIFDEIQAAPRAITSLKYFKETANEYHVIASGSLLGVAINRGGYSYPVGCVKSINLHPLDFEEFLWANNQEKLIDMIKDSYKTSKQIANPIHNIALEWYKKYLFIGGMPSAINEYVHSNNYQLVREIQNDIINNYIKDMSKYSTPLNSIKSNLIFNNISIQLAKENKKFKYSLLKAKARAKDYELALLWICSAGISSQIFRINNVKLPLKANVDFSDFKLYLNDIGLLCALHNVDYKDIINSNNVLNEFKGGLVENYVYNQLKTNNLELFYWTSKREAEVDFVTRINGDVVPIEVKSNKNVHSPSLNLFVKLYKPSYAIRISSRNFGFENNIKSIPLYATFCIKN